MEVKFVVFLIVVIPCLMSQVTAYTDFKKDEASLSRTKRAFIGRRPAFNFLGGVLGQGIRGRTSEENSWSSEDSDSDSREFGSFSDEYERDGFGSFGFFKGRK